MRFRHERHLMIRVASMLHSPFHDRLTVFRAADANDIDSPHIVSPRKRAHSLVVERTTVVCNKQPR